MIDRDTFESWPEKRQRNYAERMYSVNKKIFIDELHEAEIFRDENKELISEVHHAWYRSDCPLWYIFQFENFTASGKTTHHEIHNVTQDNWRQGTTKLHIRATAIKTRLVNENKKYNEAYSAL